MLFTTHLLIGLSLFLFLKDFFQGGNETIFLILILIGNLLPDIDQRKSKIVQWSGIIGVIISFFSKHRGFFHSIFFAVLIILPVKFIWNNYYAGGLFIGLTAHLLTDALTQRGIYLFYPFGEKIKGVLRTGKLGELLIQVILLVLIAIKLFTH